MYHFNHMDIDVKNKITTIQMQFHRMHFIMKEANVGIK